MTTVELIEKIARAGGLTRKQARAALETLVQSIIQAVKRDGALRIPDLGSFRRRSLKARMGRNPQTGEPIKIPARRKVAFTAAKSFKETVLGERRRSTTQTAA